MADRDLGVQHLVAAHEIVAPEHRRDELLAGAEHAAEGDRAFGRKQVAVLPAHLDPNALAGAVAGLAGDGAHRRRLDRDGEIDEVAAGSRATGRMLTDETRPVATSAWRKSSTRSAR